MTNLTAIKPKIQTPGQPKYELTGNFVLLETQHTKLLIPQEQVGTAEYIEQSSDWITVDNKHNSLGIAHIHTIEDQAEFHYLALSDDLLPQKNGPKSCLIGVKLKNTPDNLIWCWKRAKVLTNLHCDLHQMPLTMKSRSPIQHYVEYADFEGEMLFPCDSLQLFQYILNNSNIIGG